MRRVAPKKVGVKINLGLLELTGEWEPNSAERDAAWEVYVELITRVATVPLANDEGLLREALSSLHSVFACTREVLRKYGPDIAQPKTSGQYNFAFLAITILNSGIRPLLSKWHPALSDWEGQRAANVPPSVHERAWHHAGEFRDELESTRQALVDYSAALATACGVPNLLGPATTSPPAE